MDTERKAAYDDLLAFMAEAPDVPALGDASRESDRAILAERYEDGDDEVDDYVPAELAVGFLEAIEAYRAGKLETCSLEEVKEHCGLANAAGADMSD